MATKQDQAEHRNSLPTTGRVLVHAAMVYDLLQPIMMLGRGGRLNREIADAVAPVDGERILDLGCGTGLLTVEVARRMSSGEVVGIDASIPMIETATRKRASGVCRFQAALAEELPFDDETFDAVTSDLFFHHISLDLKRRAADEMMRVLRPGGRMAIADIDRPWSAFGWFFACSGWMVFRQSEIKENIDGLLPDVLRDAGFADLEPGYGTLGCLRVWSARKPE